MTGRLLREDEAAGLPESAAGWNDLAVARLERAALDEQPADLVRALAALDRALNLEPDLPQARFNRALALDRLHLRGRASEAWRAYLELDPSSAWAERARERLRAVEAPSLAERWEQELPRLEAAVERGDAAAVRAVVRRFPHRARVAVEEEALGDWATARRAGDLGEAVRRLAFARVVGRALEATTGDAMARDAVELIDRAVREDRSPELELLVAGHAAFDRGLALYRDQEGEAALPLLAGAARDLRAAGSPFADWADFYATVCTHYADSVDALRAFERLDDGTDAARHPVLAGFRSWMVGTVASYLNRLEEALAAFAVARERLASAGAPPETHGFVHVLFAETYELLGEPDQAWRERLAALEAAAEGGDRRRLHSTLQEAAGAAATIDPRAALDFVGELLANDRAWGNDGALVEAHALAGRLNAELGRYGEALEHLGDARDHALAVGRGEQAEHIAMEAALAEGEALVEADPRSAVDRLTAALESARRRSFPGFDDRMLVARARAWRALGNVGAAEEDLAAALEVHEGVRGELVSERLRLSYFDAAQDAFDAMIRLQADERASPSGAFAVAERARARLLLDMAGRDTGSAELPGPLPAAAIARRLPEGTVLVEYAVLPDRLLVWTVRAGSVEMTSLPRAAEDLARRVAALRSAIDGRADGARIRAVAGPLYDTLLRPALDGLPEGAPLVVVPDRFLSEVPFPVLFDRRRGRYLIEDRPVVVAPSATLYVNARERARSFRGVRTALAIGDPAFDQRAHPTLGRLPAAAEEAVEVASVYPGSVLLLGDEATPEALIEAAPGHRILHVSGHAVIDPESPWNHRLILAPGARESGAAGSSLDARRIASLRLPGTEIVVLSACHTLPGGPERESFHGLAAAFFAAGPPVVVSSLWQIDDRPTRTLMVRFHRALAGGAAPADALREAQLHLLRQDDPTLATPAAWGAFEAFGGAIAR